MIHSEPVKIRKKTAVKATPAMVATVFVKILVIATASSSPTMSPNPTGISLPRTWKFRGNFQPINQVVAIFADANVIWYEHHRCERRERCKHEGVKEDNQARTGEVPAFRRFDLTVNLCQCLFATHCQNGMAQRDHEHRGTHR